MSDSIDYEEAIKQFADRYGMGNIMVILSGSTNVIYSDGLGFGFLVTSKYP